MSHPTVSAAVHIRRLVEFVGRRTFGDPVRNGRLVDTGWPPGLRGIVGLGLVVYAVLLLSAVGAAVLRRHAPLLFTPPSQVLPALAVPLVALAAIVALTCLFTAALHLVWWLRVPVGVVVVAILFLPVDWSAMTPVDWVTVGFGGLLVALAAARWNRDFHWLEFVFSLGLIGQAVVGHQLVRLAGLRQVAPGVAVSELSQITLPLWALAVPVAILAGAALVEITASAVTWTVAALWRGGLVRGSGPAPWVAMALAVLVVGRAAQVAYDLTDAADPLRPAHLVAGVGVVAAALAAFGAVSWLADRVPIGDPARRPDPDDLLPVWGRCTPALALVLAAGVSLQLLIGLVLRGLALPGVGQQVRDLGGDQATVAWTIAGCAGTAAGALILARRGRRLAALLVAAFSVMTGTALLAEWAQLTISTDGILAVLSAAAVLVLGWLAVRRRLTREAEVALAGVLLLGAAYDYRDWIDEPLTQALGLVGVSAALLVGLLWRILTDNAYTRGDSARFPQPSRVLLALGNALVGAASAAQVALWGGKFDLDLSQVEGIGDTYLGFPLVLALSFAGLALAVRGRNVTGRSGPSHPRLIAGVGTGSGEIMGPTRP